MDFAVLGPVLVDGQPPRGAIERAVLARLLVAPGAPVSSTELIEAAWPDDRRDNAAASLRVRLARLRALVEPDRDPGASPRVLVRDPAGYRLITAPASVDAERFTRIADEVGRLPPGAALARCDEGLALWRGEPFPELDLVDAAAAEARRLRAIRDRLRHRRALALLEAGRPEDAADELEALVEEDPLREELVRDLMHARYRAGRQTEALAAYRALVGRLAEVGLRPGPEVRELEALVLRHELKPAGGTTPFPALHPTNVGAPLASVVGREDEVAGVAAALADHRIVTLVGPGGVGKTTLATEVVRAVLERFADGAWIVELSPLRDTGDVAPVAATTLGLRRIGRGADLDQRDALQLLRERLRDAGIMLVLDAAEHLLPGLAPAAPERLALTRGNRGLARCAARITVAHGPPAARWCSPESPRPSRSPTPPARAASSTSSGDVWLAKADGSAQRALTRNGSPRNPYRSPAVSDRGVITAVNGQRDIHLLNRSGKRLRMARDIGGGPTPPSDPVVIDHAITPDGRGSRRRCG